MLRIRRSDTAVIASAASAAALALRPPAEFQPSSWLLWRLFIRGLGWLKLWL